jgi:hypothetical protein
MEVYGKLSGSNSGETVDIGLSSGISVVSYSGELLALSMPGFEVGFVIGVSLGLVISGFGVSLGCVLFGCGTFDGSGLDIFHLPFILFNIRIVNSVHYSFA